MSVKLAKLLSMLAGSQNDTTKKIGKGVMIAVISPFVAVTVLIGAIFTDGINFNKNIITSLYEGTPITGFDGEKGEFIKDVQHGLSLIDTEINVTNQTFTNGAVLNSYQVKGYYIGLMFSSQKIVLNEEKAKQWVKCFTVQTEEAGNMIPTSINSTIYSQIESYFEIILEDETKEAMERIYGGLIGNNSGTVTTLTKEELDKLLSQLPKETSELRKKIVLQAGDAVGKIPYYWGGTADCAGYEGNDFGTTIVPDEKGRNKKGLDCSHFVDWVYWTVMNNNLGNTNTSGQIKLCRKISSDELLAGDLAFLMDTQGNTTHVGIYSGTNDKGEKVWIHENAHDNNVAVNTVSYWSGYYRLNFMEGR
ncbi:C40 family peptidase [Thomasclavelia cocleata]|jgi:cell wall-associated NlpC family hydrolase|uniref:C40 family peptidase n=1 Tax=Thomasclavelia cocleata TaxID=69824 RepID=UPI00241E9564|nr:NlpC/P60 family protein [Thomasclavelia cocleata]